MSSTPLPLPQSGDSPRGHLFLDRSFGTLLERVVESLVERRGLTLIHGPAGSGKSMLLEAARERVPQGFVWCQPERPPQSVAELYRAVLPRGTEAQIPDEGPIPSAVREALELWLRQRATKGTWTVLAVDDVDRVGPEVPEHIDALAGLEPMLQIVMTAAAPGFLEGDRDTDAVALGTRLRQRFEIAGLPREEWRDFLAWWSELDGGSLPPAADSIDALGGLTGGMPGRMLEVWGRAEELAREQWMREITKECVQLAAAGGPDGVAAPGGVGRARLRREPESRLPESSAGPLVETEDGSAAAATTPAANIASVATAAAPVPGRLSPSATRDPFRDSPGATSLDAAELLPVLSDPHGIHSEWFRVLQVRLEDWIRGQGGGPKTIVVSGPDAAAGKTLVAANLALLWAHDSYQRVLLVDGDLRRPQFHSVFEIPRRPGFADLLAGRCTLEECSAFISEVGLHVVTAGRPGNPRQLMEPGRVARAFDAARASFDVIVVDSPPLSAMVDSRSMASAADGVVLVLRAGKTRLGALEHAVENLPGDNLIGTVVNGGERDGDSAHAEYRRSTGA